MLETERGRAAPSAGTPHAWLLAAARAVATPALAARLPQVLDADIRNAWEMVKAASGLNGAALAASAATVLGLPVFDPSRIERRATKLLPERVARQLGVMPVVVGEDFVEVAAPDPLNLAVEADLEFAVGRRVRFEVADPATIREYLDAEYAPDRAIEAMASGFSPTDAPVILEDEIKQAPSAVDDPTGAVRRLAATLLRDAVLQGASDVHLAPNGSQGIVRYRLDGIMRQVLTMPGAVYARVVSRLKVIGGLDISDHRRPQDGRSRVVIGGMPVDLRISSLPLEGGSERLVLRLLLHQTISSLDTLDLIEPERTQLLTLMDLADGMILMTGPTGSGKTTTLHAALKRRMSPDVTIMTVENPVEYRIDGISQVQVEPKAGLTFASALRAMLRQDPDIVLVGEVRDHETAETAAQAAMTGHLVLSTVHADDAPGALLRLRDLGLDIDTLSESFRGAAAQRLLRKICPDCHARPTVEDATEHELAYRGITGELPMARAVGCLKCGFTGFKGRLPIHQVFTVDATIRELMARRAPTEEIRAAARRAGMRSLGESAHSRIAAGQTTVDEAVRVLGSRFWAEIRGREPDDAVETTEASDVLLEEAELLARARSAQRAPASIMVYSADADVRAALLRGCAAAGVETIATSTVAEAARVTRRTAGIRLVVLHLGPQSAEDPVGAVGTLIDLRRALGDITMPVLLVAPADHPTLHLMMRTAGVDDFLTVPVDEAKLTRRARAALRRSAAVAALDA